MTTACQQLNQLIELQRAGRTSIQICLEIGRPSLRTILSPHCDLFRGGATTLRGAGPSLFCIVVRVRRRPVLQQVNCGLRKEVFFWKIVRMERPVQFFAFSDLEVLAMVIDDSKQFENWVVSSQRAQVQCQKVQSTSFAMDARYTRETVSSAAKVKQSPVKPIPQKRSPAKSPQVELNRRPSGWMWDWTWRSSTVRSLKIRR